MKAFCAIAVAALLPLSSLDAATATFSAATGLGPSNPNVSVGRSPSAAQISAGVPADSRIHEFLVTTDADIVQVGDVNLSLVGSTGLYQVANAQGGSDTEPPSAAFETFFPELGADSWITTPGPTSNPGNSNGRPFEDRDGSWYDSREDGPVTNFMFARITVYGAGQFNFRGRVQLDGPSGPENFPFEFFTVPEPASFSLAGFGLLGLAAMRRRYT
jgi:hypothetical protein